MRQWIKNALAVAIGVYIGAVAVRVTEKLATAEAPEAYALLVHLTSSKR